MRVLQIISSGGMYGAESVILNLARTMNRGAHHVSLGVFVNSAKPSLQLYEKAAREGIDTHRIRCEGRLDRTAIAAIRDLALQTEAEVVHAHGYKADIYAYLALHRTGVPLVSTCHTWYDNDVLVRIYGWLDRIALRKYAGIVAVSQDVKARLLKAGVPRERIRVIRNGIDLGPYGPNGDGGPHCPGRDSGPVVGLVGRLSIEKGVDIFLRSAAQVVRRFPATRFVVAGDGPDKAVLDRLIDELGIGTNVSMLGRCDDMPAVYRSFDVQVSSSRHEGLPMALIEGMASGLPIIATAVGDVPNLIRDDQTGVLLSSGDTQRLASSIVDLLDDPKRQTRLGARARQLVERDFSAERMTGEYLEVYEDVTRVSAHRCRVNRPNRYIAFR